MFCENVSCSIHKCGKSGSIIKASYRFLSNPKVKESILVDALKDQCALNVEGRKVLVFCDSSSINIENHKNRIQNVEGLGRIGRNQAKQTLGFLVHPLLVYDAHKGSALGIASVKLISRPMGENIYLDRSREINSLMIEEKESYKWLNPCIESLDTSLKEAQHVTFIMDREADIMEIYDRLKSEKSDVLIRARHNRNVLDDQDKPSKLYDLIAESEVKGSTWINIEGGERKNRKAKLAIRYIKCKLLWNNAKEVSVKNQEKGVSVSIIEVREITHAGYENEPPLIWRLITTKEIDSLQQAIEQIHNYEKRWKIEEFFKLLKTDGYNIESTELTTGKAIRKLTLILMKTSIKILQLKEARDGNNDQTIDQVFSIKEIECLEKLNESLEGQTEKQKNPHPKNSLARASWVIARLGGWKEFYAKNRPPGNKTYAWGLEKFDSIMAGYALFEEMNKCLKNVG
jgi:hypothetical protein